MKFQCHNPIVLCCTIVRHAIGEHRGYAAEISFGLAKIEQLKETLRQRDEEQRQ
jgi:hypothetical protein